MSAVSGSLIAGRFLDVSAAWSNPAGPSPNAPIASPASVGHGSSVSPQVGHDRFLLDRARPLGPGYCVGPSLFQLPRPSPASAPAAAPPRAAPSLPSPAPTSPTSRRSPSAVLTSTPPRS